MVTSKVIGLCMCCSQQKLTFVQKKNGKKKKELVSVAVASIEQRPSHHQHTNGGVFAVNCRQMVSLITQSNEVKLTTNTTIAIMYLKKQQF